MAHCLGYHEDVPEKRPGRALVDVKKGMEVILTRANKKITSKIRTMIHQSLPNLLVEDVLEIKNSFLEKMYELKKEEYKVRYRKVSEMQLFHATSAANVDPIVKDNFNWRKVSRGKFGLGNSFSDSAKYANGVANEAIGSERAFIITKVLVANKIEGRRSMKVPPSKYDTTTGNNTVFVKFSDNEVLPQYVVYYNDQDLYSDDDEDYHDVYSYNDDVYGVYF